MKSERRHELQHNELADWLIRTGQQIKPYQTHIMMGVVALLVAIIGWNLWSRASASQTTKAWAELDSAMQTDDLKVLAKVIETYPNTNVAYVGSAVLGDLHLDAGCKQQFIDKATALKELSAATVAYEMVLKNCQIPSLRERATYGLARTKEAQCDLPAAKKLYEEVIEKWKDGTYATVTQEHLAELDQHETKKVLDDLRNKFTPAGAFSDDTGMPSGFAEPAEPAEKSVVTPEKKPATKADEKKPATKAEDVKPAAKAEEKKPEKGGDTKK